MAYMSPRWTREQFDAGEVDSIEIFRDQISGWLFEQADRLGNDDNASVAMLMLVTPYFETITCYLKGREPKRRESGVFLRDGLREVYPGIPDDVADAFVKEVRNGLFHESTFRNLTLHHGDPRFLPLGVLPFFVRGALFKTLLMVDPWVMLDTVKAHLVAYVVRLRDQPKEAALLASFNAFMAIRLAR